MEYKPLERDWGFLIFILELIDPWCFTWGVFIKILTRGKEKVWYWVNFFPQELIELNHSNGKSILSHDLDTPSKVKDWRMNFLLGGEDPIRFPVLVKRTGWREYVIRVYLSSFVCRGGTFISILPVDFWRKKGLVKTAEINATLWNWLIIITERKI